MIIEIFESAEEASAHVSSMLCEQVKSQPNSVLGLATGGTMEAVYARLVEEAREKKISFKDVTSFNLDEYIGLPADHPNSYRQYMNTRLFEQIDIQMANTHIPNGAADDPQIEADRYEALIKSLGPIDFQLLGIGRNGHIGFNEPLSSLGSRTRIKGLTENTRKANQRYFDSYDETPSTAITMGIATIMDAKKCVLLATGEGKAEAIKAACEGPVTSMCPASILQHHPKAVFVLDQAAASLLTSVD